MTAVEAPGAPWWHARLYAPRVLEPEVMDEGDEAEAYMDATAQSHLAVLDASWVARVMAFGPRGRARLLDVGTGGGQIPAMLAERRPEWRVWAVDRARAMLAAGRAEITRSEREARRAAQPFRLGLAEADARRLPFADGAFDLAISNSLLHHLADPKPILDEIARVSLGPVLLRDLRRPARWRARLHVAWYGRHYRGTMRKLYEDSVAAAFTVAEMERAIESTRLAGARVLREGPYLVVERA